MLEDKLTTSDENINVFLYMYLVAYEKEDQGSHCSPEKQSLAKSKIAQNYDYIS